MRRRAGSHWQSVANCQHGQPTHSAVSRRAGLSSQDRPLSLRCVRAVRTVSSIPDNGIRRWAWSTFPGFHDQDMFVSRVPPDHSTWPIKTMAHPVHRQAATNSDCRQLAVELNSDALAGDRQTSNLDDNSHEYRTVWFSEQRSLADRNHKRNSPRVLALIDASRPGIPSWRWIRV